MHLTDTIGIRGRCDLLAAFGVLWYFSVYLVRPGDIRPQPFPELRILFSAFLFLVPVLSPVLLGMLLRGYFLSGRRHTVWVCVAAVIVLSTTVLSAVYLCLLLRH